MTKILMMGTFSSLNKGDAAMQISTMYAIKKHIHDADFTLLTPFPEIDSSRYSNVKIAKSSLLSPLKLFFLLFRCVLWTISNKVFCSNLKKLIDQRELREYVQAEIVLHVSGDGFGEVYSIPAAISQYCIVLLGILLNKPVVIYAQSLGPFKKTKFLARSILNKVALITVREELSEKYLQKIGVNKPPICLTADSAFLLRPATEERVNEIMTKEGCNKGANQFVCISASRLIASRYKNRKSEPKYTSFIELMAQVVDYLTTELNVTVILLPHVMGPYERNDDRIMNKQIYEMVKLKRKAQVINNEYTPEEIRGIFGRCVFLIGGRTHACIAGISMGVPAIAIAYSHKTYGIMKMLDLEKYICDARGLEISELKSKIDELWLAGEKIKRDLMPKLKVVNERAFFNAKLVKKLINSLKARTPHAKRVEENVDHFLEMEK